MNNFFKKFKIPAVIAAVVLVFVFAIFWQLKHPALPSGADALIVLASPKPAELMEKPKPESTEVVEMRTETSKTFDNHDGTFTYKSGAVTHYENAFASSEEWKEIDPVFYSDYPEYRLYDRLPFAVKVFKNKTGYEISSKKTNQKYLVLLDSVEGVKMEKYENSADFIFEYEIKPDAVRLWKNLLTEKAPKNFIWKITESGIGDLAFRENPEAFDLKSLEQVKIQTEKTPIDNSSFYWEETAPRAGLKVDTDVYYSSESSDDCEVNNVYWYYESLTLIRVGNIFDGGDDENYLSDAGLRFLNVAVPKSATINTASISLYIQSVTGTNLPPTIKGIAEDNTPTWALLNNLNHRTKTFESVSWNPLPSAGGTRTSPDISNIIQEIVDREGWASGNALGLAILDATPYNWGITDFISFRSFDYGSDYPSLSITYTGGEGGGTSPAIGAKETLEGGIKLEGDIKIE